MHLIEDRADTNFMVLVIFKSFILQSVDKLVNMSFYSYYKYLSITYNYIT